MDFIFFLWLPLIELLRKKYYKRIIDMSKEITHASRYLDSAATSG